LIELASLRQAQQVMVQAFDRMIVRRLSMCLKLYEVDAPWR
jgi:hypothetical protein